MRTFIAIEIPQDVKRQLRAEQDRLKGLPALRAQPSLLRWTNTDKMHLTLRFLGETEGSQRAKIQDGLTAIAAAHAPFTLVPSRLGCFRSWSNLRVLWVGIEGETEALQEVQADAETLARQTGFSSERNRFAPHITLARVARHAPRPALRAAADQLRRAAEEEKSQSWTEWRIKKLQFIRSVLGPGGAQYSDLATCPLTGCE